MALSGMALMIVLDQDGVPGLSEIERQNAPAVLKALDRNADGFVTADEIPMPARGGRGAAGGPARGRGEGPPRDAAPTSPAELASALMAFDRNNDGKLTVAEVPARFRGIFDRVDANKDQQITPEELSQFAAAQAQPANAPIPEGRGDDRGREGRGGEGREGRAGGPRVDALIQQLDIDKDGKLSFAEIDTVTAVLDAFDRNADGVVTIQEVFLQPGRATAPPADAR